MTTKTLSKRIRGFYRKNLKEYRILLIGNCLALATFIGAFISPFWIIDSSGQDKENYGSFWVCLIISCNKNNNIFLELTYKQNDNKCISNEN